jgi:hypothetical protein
MVWSSCQAVALPATIFILLLGRTKSCLLDAHSPEVNYFTLPRKADNIKEIIMGVTRGKMFSSTLYFLYIKVSHFQSSKLVPPPLFDFFYYCMMYGKQI